MFKQAVKYAAKLRLAIAGPSGSGKTYTALAIASHLGKRIALVDTEHGSASKYADVFTFDVLELRPPFHPDRFSEAVKEAEQAGYDVVILDSLSHAWNGAGGALELVEQYSKKYKGNSYAAWGDVTPIQNRLIEAIVGAGIHVIATMRSKQDYILVERNGKQMPQKVGMAPVQRDGFEYEFDVMMDMDIENTGIVSKSRCSALAGKVISKPGADVAAILRDWLGGVQAPEPTGGNNQPPPAESGKATDGHRIADLRAALESNPQPTLSSVASSAAATGVYSHANHALQAMKEFAFPDGVKVIGSQKVSRDGALKIFDWLMARKGVEDDAGDNDDLPTLAYDVSEQV